MFTPHNIFHFREQVEVTGCQIRRTERVVHGSDFVFGQKLTRNERGVRRCIVLMQDPRVLCLQFGSGTSHTFMQTLQDFNIEFCTKSLTFWNIFMMNNSTNIKKTMNMVLIFERPLRAFLVRGEPGCFHSSLSFLFQGHTRKSSFASSYQFFAKMWILGTLDPVVATINMSLFLLVSQNFWNNFCTQLPHVQIFF